MKNELEKYKQYAEELGKRIEELEQQLKVTEKDRDETKLALQGATVKYLELYAEKNGLDKEEVFKEVGQGVKKILEG